MLGHRSRQDVSAEMRRAHFLVMPSEWYECFPMVMVEAFAHGLPVIASNLGTMAEVVEHGISGLLFRPGDADALVRTVEWTSAHPRDMERMGEHARQAYIERYTPETNYEQLLEIYRQAGANCM